MSDSKDPFGDALKEFEATFRAKLDEKGWPKLPLLDFSIESYLGDSKPTPIQLRDEAFKIADDLASKVSAGTPSVLLIKNKTALNCRLSSPNELVAGHDRRPLS